MESLYCSLLVPIMDNVIYESNFLDKTNYHVEVIFQNYIPTPFSYRAIEELTAELRLVSDPPKILPAREQEVVSLYRQSQKIVNLIQA